ncbi:hypothetical protein EWM64_g1839 [Hericium alpestre]|uniref:Uncharacterized protein n=1 Tax=Hericium alpestre TaxID=135208 RepID=A0A4Z0A9C7_9AGAM|nr:hypothetical protein EWM64_g1839 [Hericium alpestre]
MPGDQGHASFTLSEVLLVLLVSTFITTMSAARIIYGTAWKKERTAALVVSAVLNGFRAIDTGEVKKRHLSLY